MTKMVTATLPLSLPVPTGEFGEPWNGAVGVARPDVVEHSSTGGCGTSPYRPSGAVQRVRHIGRSMPSVSFIFRRKNRAYFSSLSAISSAVSWQLSI
ncbi:hypothetical protein [Streptomyces iconiensis]|uniref:Uncharacterized protein n=1 Tax=Streptomyces iconiensis TaxID=1384038 RepID=A0ABT7A3V8_9ACTN|nr:hypothetical protein [Streptomyces iconiensis]MDJ1135747.1 hypothetical protein [Streptomyces iconiensis]